MFEGCKIRFRGLSRRHHCRACGHIFCARHSSEKMLVSTLGVKPLLFNQGKECPDRVCTDCYARSPQGEMDKSQRAKPEGRILGSLQNLAFEVSGVLMHKKGTKPKTKTDGKNDGQVRCVVTSHTRKASEPGVASLAHDFSKAFPLAIRSVAALESLSDRPLPDLFHDGSLYLRPAHFAEALTHESFSGSTRYSFTTFAPLAFRAIRNLLAGADSTQAHKAAAESTEKEFLASMSALTGGSTGAGKSGQLFYKSRDGKYVLKTLPQDEANVLRSILPEYYTHFRKARIRSRVDGGRSTPLYRGFAPSIDAKRALFTTLMCRFVGLYSITLGKDGTPVFLVCMENGLRADSSGAIRPSVMYDLKGSRHSRYVDEAKIPEGKTPCLKDINWTNKHIQIGLPSETLDPLLRALERDVNFLRSFNIIDYSLLVGLQALPGRTGPPSAGPPRRVWLQIIDVLQIFNLKKRGERFLKKAVMNYKDVSSEDRNTYAKRFCKFVNDEVFRTVAATRNADILVDTATSFCIAADALDAGDKGVQGKT